MRLSLSPCLAVLLCVSGARAEIVEDARTMLLGHSVWAGVFQEQGAGQLSSGAVQPKAVGVRYYERSGLISGMLMGIFASAGAGMAAASPKSVERRREGNWVITKTTYRSAAEQKKITDDGAAAAAAIATASNQSFELNLFTRGLPGGGESTGYRLDMFFGDTWGDSVVFDIGFGWGIVESLTRLEGRAARVKYSYIGIPVRLNVAAGPVLIWGQWDWNWFGHTDLDTPRDDAERLYREVAPFPIKLGVATNLFGRLFAEGVVTTPAYDSGEFGLRVNAGLRF